MHVHQICNPDVATVDSGKSVLDAARVMRESHVGDVVVVDPDADGLHPVGIVTDRDIVVGLVAREVTDMASLTVDDVLTRQLITCLEDDSVIDAAATMREHGIRRLPVVDTDNRLLGIVTLDDILTVLAEALQDLAFTAVSQSRREREQRP